MNIASKCIIVLAVLPTWVGAAAAQAPGIDWSKTYGGMKPEEVHAIDVAPGGYVIAGKTTSFGGGNADMYVLKTDENGDSLWMTVWGTSRQERGRDIVSCSGGGYAVVGNERLTQNGMPQVFFHRLDAAGTIVTTKNYGHLGNDRAYSIVETSDGGFAMAGYTDVSNSGQTDVYLIRTDANGDTLWTRTYGGPDDDEGYRAEQTSDGGFIVTGGTSSPSGGSGFDVYLIRTDANGDTLWTRTYGGAEYDIGFCVRQTVDGGFVIAGKSRSFTMDGGDFYLVKTDAVGDTLWTRVYNGYEDDEARSVIEVNNGYTVAGHTLTGLGNGRDMYVVRTNLLGEVLWSKYVGGAGEDWGNDIVPSGDGGYVAAGYSDSWDSDDNAWLVKLLPDPTGACDRTPNSRLHIEARPNPFNPSTTITYRVPRAGHVTVSVYDVSGRRVATLFDAERAAGEHVVHWSATDFASGVYFVRIGASSETRVAKVVLLK